MSTNFIAMWRCIKYCSFVYNKSNSMNKAMRVEANLAGTPADFTIFFNKCITTKCWTIENEDQSQSMVQYSNWCHAMATSVKVVWCFFAIILTIFEIFTFKISWSWTYRSRSSYKYLTSYLTALIMFAFFQPCQNMCLKSLTLTI